ncbi:MAG: hypothetical protein Q4G03_07225 [Planctomycetia bacterium]|nr:hypothetical protein [Planctomycetia bacterium]
MKKTIVLLAFGAVILSFFATTTVNAQGFGNYVAPGATQTGAAVAPQPQITPNNTGVTAATPTNVVNVAPTTTVTPATSVANPNTTANVGAPQGGYIPAEVSSAIAPPPENFKITEAEQKQLDEFLARWEQFSKNVKRVSCDVHTKQYDDVLQPNSKKPISHTWGQFRYIAPNKLLYHVRGEFVPSETAESGEEWKESQNEQKIVLTGKALVTYDFQKKVATFFPVVADEQDMDLSVDNGQFPLFFTANANLLKNHFYLRINTPKGKEQSQIWLEAYPRYARDAEQYQVIIVILNLKDLQPTYMRRISANGKSKTDLSFVNVVVNKGLWNIDGDVAPGWTKEVREEEYSIMRQGFLSNDGVQYATSQPASAGNTASQPVATAQPAKGAPTTRPVANAAAGSVAQRTQQRVATTGTSTSAVAPQRVANTANAAETAPRAVNGNGRY